MENIYDLDEEELWNSIPLFEGEKRDYGFMWEIISEVLKKRNREYDEYVSLDDLLQYIKIDEGTIPEPPPPQKKEERKPKDDFKYLNFVKYVKRHEDDSVVNRLRIENDRLRRENRELKNKLKQQLRDEAQNRKDYKASNSPFSYKEWKEFNTSENQTNIVLDRWDEFMRSPYENIIEFGDLSREGKKQMFPLLKEWLIDYVGNSSASNRYKFNFRICGVWHSRTLTPEVFRELKEKFTENSFIYTIDTEGETFNSDPEITEIPPWSMYDAVSIKEVKQKGNKEIGGSFFKHLNISGLDLSRYQIFDSLTEVKQTQAQGAKERGNEEKKVLIQRRELNDCCFIYSLMMSNMLSEEEIKAMKLRIRHRNLSQANVRFLCEEFGIKSVIRNIKHN